MKNVLSILLSFSLLLTSVPMTEQADLRGQWMSAVEEERQTQVYIAEEELEISQEETEARKENAAGRQEEGELDKQEQEVKKELMEPTEPVEVAAESRAAGVDFVNVHQDKESKCLSLLEGETVYPENKEGYHTAVSRKVNCRHTSLGYRTGSIKCERGGQPAEPDKRGTEE